MLLDAFFSCELYIPEYEHDIHNSTTMAYQTTEQRKELVRVCRFLYWCGRYGDDV